MKNPLFLLIISVFPMICQAQGPSSRYYTEPIVVSNIDRYGVEYILKNYSFPPGDSTILNQLDLEAAETHRSMTENIEHFDVVTGLTLILFFEKKEITKQ